MSKPISHLITVLAASLLALPGFCADTKKLPIKQTETTITTTALKPTTTLKPTAPATTTTNPSPARTDWKDKKISADIMSLNKTPAADSSKTPIGTNKNIVNMKNPGLDTNSKFLVDEKFSKIKKIPVDPGGPVGRDLLHPIGPGGQDPDRVRLVDPGIKVFPTPIPGKFPAPDGGDTDAAAGTLGGPGGRRDPGGFGVPGGPNQPGYSVSDIIKMTAVGRRELAGIPQSPQTATANRLLDQLDGLAASMKNEASSMPGGETAAQAAAARQAQAAQARAGQASASPAPGGAANQSDPSWKGVPGGAGAGSIPGQDPARAGGPMQAQGAPILGPGEFGGGTISKLPPEDMLLDATRRLQANPNDVKARADRAEALVQLGDYDAAVEEANQALQLDPNNVQALNARASANIKRGQYEFALQDADRLLKLDSANALGHLNRAMALEGLGRFAEALQEYVLAAQLDPALKSFLVQAQARLAGTAGSRTAPGTRAVLWALAALLAAGLPLGLWAWRRSTAAPPAPAQKVDVGTVIGANYRIEKLIGEGGMGKVFEGYDTVIRRKVAIKMMRAEIRREIGDEQIIEEARLVALVRHPNVVEIYAALQEAGEIFLVFDYVAGRPLYNLMQAKGRLSLPEAAHILGCLAAGLDCAHSKRVIHRDLKPGNVVISNEGIPKLMDFGLAHRSRLPDSQESAAASGTMPYMAPEQHDGAVSKESDIFSLGVMAYEMLTGRRPFDGPDQLRHKHQGTFTPASVAAPGLPPSIDAVLARALAPQPEGRFHSGAEFVSALVG